MRALSGLISALSSLISAFLGLKELSQAWNKPSQAWNQELRRGWSFVEDGDYCSSNNPSVHLCVPPSCLSGYKSGLLAQIKSLKAQAGSNSPLRPHISHLGLKSALSCLKAALSDHCTKGIALDGSLGIWVKIFISTIRLKLSRMVRVVFVHVLPVHMTGFLAI